MSVLLNKLNAAIEPLSAAQETEPRCTGKSISERIYNLCAAGFSGIGNWPFYGVAKSFGDRYSKGFGGLLGTCEFASYFTFRIRNFQALKEQLFAKNTAPPESPASNESSPSYSDEDHKETIPLARSLYSNPSDSPSYNRSSWDWKTTALKVGATILGLSAQFPIMVLIYYGNGENLLYPILSGACEASFTILSLLLSLQKKKQEAALPGIEKTRTDLTAQINQFLQELPEKSKDPTFIGQVNTVFSQENPTNSLLSLVFNKPLAPKQDQSSCDYVLGNLAKGIGYLTSVYLTAVNGSVSYKGILQWRSNQKALAVATTALVSLANLKLLTNLCVDSAKNYYEGLRDLLKGTYRPPLAYSVSPAGWLFGRLAANIGSWFSFGTTALGAQEYFPKIGNALAWAAPVSSTLLLHDNLAAASDDLLLWAGSKTNEKTRQLYALNNILVKFKEELQNASAEELEQFNQLLNLMSQQNSMITPLLGPQPNSGPPFPTDDE